jgi:hypothetical protein
VKLGRARRVGGREARDGSRDVDGAASLSGRAFRAGAECGQAVEQVAEHAAPFDGRMVGKHGRWAITFDCCEPCGLDLARFWPEKSPKNMDMTVRCGRRHLCTILFIQVSAQKVMAG